VFKNLLNGLHRLEGFVPFPHGLPQLLVQLGSQLLPRPLGILQLKTVLALSYRGRGFPEPGLEASPAKILAGGIRFALRKPGGGIRYRSGHIEIAPHIFN